MGAVSGNLETVDFDEDAETVFLSGKSLSERRPGLVGRLTKIGTPRGGFHVRYRCSEAVEGTQKLAEIAATGKVRIETRGEGGYAVALAGDVGEVPPVEQDLRTPCRKPPPWEPPVITPEERAILLTAARAFDLLPYEPSDERKAGQSKYEVTPWDDFQARGPGWSEILTARGWTLVTERAGASYWKRPGANAEWSATVNFSGNDLLHVFSTNSGLPANKSYSRYAAVVHFDYAGDFRRGAEEMERLGYGKVRPGNNGSAQSRVKSPPPWGEPQPLPSGILLPVVPFDCNLLPWSFMPWLKDVAERTQAPIDFSAAPAMVALSAVIGRRLAIRPKQHDDWTVIPNLWGMIVGRPGVMKSQAIGEAMKPLTRMEIEAGKRYEDALREYAANEMIAAAQKKAAEKAVAKALQNGDPNEARRLAQQAIDEESRPPVRRRYLVSDATVEKLGEILKDNPFGVCQLRDELLGLLKSLDKEGAKPIGHSCWRRGTATVALCTTGLPAARSLSSRFAFRSSGGSSRGHWGITNAWPPGMAAKPTDGLLQRFQLAVYPDVAKEWVNVDRWPDSESKNVAYSVFKTLERIVPAEAGAKLDDNDPDGVPYLRFSPLAQRPLLTPGGQNWNRGCDRMLSILPLPVIWGNIEASCRPWRC